MQRNWKIQPHDAGLVASIPKSAGVSPVVAHLLAARGMTDPAVIREFLDKPFQNLRAPCLLPGAEEAARLVFQAVQDGKRICIYGDYDADGMTATAILVRCLKMLGGDVFSFVPSRLDDGYGLSVDALQRVQQQGADLVVTVDCGIASLQEALAAREMGLTLIITDHHQYGDELPAAAAIVHPALPGHQYPFTGLCGAGVALKLAWALCQLASGNDRVSEAHRNFLLIALGLAAIGTVADVVPLQDENRLIVAHGLVFMRHQTVTGLQQLMHLTQLHEKRKLGSQDIAFCLAPRLNAAGRLGQAQLGVELLTTDSESRAEALATYIHQLNSSRESLERRIQKAAVRMITDQHLADEPALVLNSRDWHKGVIGIVAGRIAEKYNRPAVLIAQEEVAGNGPATGSGRSACGVDLYQALQACRPWLVSCGGHRAAAGVRIEDENIDAFREAFCQYVAEHTEPADFEACLRIDLEVPLSHLNLRTITELDALAPFGMGNRRPVFCATGLRLAAPPKRMGGGERHLSLQVTQHNIQMRAVAFGGGEWADQLDWESGVYDFAFKPVINEFRGRRSVELQIVDWRKSEVPAHLVQ
jgi:single-stranded-DNA-specific exonuclease